MTTCERFGHALSLDHGARGHECHRCQVELPDPADCETCELAAVRRDRDELLAELRNAILSLENYHGVRGPACRGCARACALIARIESA